ncbi:MAG: hypothetical protein IPF64_18050 [Flavobacteriales bacterium]|nr:hypothetical protein [Flavobacteriales bacterium]
MHAHSCAGFAVPTDILWPYATDRTGLAQAELFKHVERPAFPFRVFTMREAAYRWARERRQLADVLARDRT